jgi:ankyrin repeat protein
MGCTTNLALGHSEMSVPWSDEAFLNLADRTPWRSFMHFIHSLATTGPLQLLYPPMTETVDIVQAQNVSINQNTDVGFEVAHGKRSHCWTNWREEMSCALYLSEFAGCFVPIQTTNLAPYLPPKKGPLDINVEATTDLSTKSTQLEFLKLAAHLISNNFDVKRVSLVIVELAQDKRNRALFRSLLDQKLLVADAMAEKLLIPAVQGKNMPLIKLLLEAGCDINIEMRRVTEATNTALQCAVKQSSGDLVTFLLDNGANGNRHKQVDVYHQGHELYFNSLLDVAVFHGSPSIVMELLKSRPRFQHGNPEITIETLRIATVRDNIDMFLFLMEQDPDLDELIHSQPWILLEAAALQGNDSLFSYLEQCGLDINQTDELGMGSPLAATSASGNMTLLRHLRERNASLSSVMVGFSPNLVLSLQKGFSFMYYRGLAALHAAICNQDEEIVQFLLSEGANVNQCCYAQNHYQNFPVFPIQLATYYRNTVFVKMLLAAGADPDATVGPTRAIDSEIAFKRVTGRVALQISLELGDELIFYELLQHGAKMPTNLTHADGWDPLISVMHGGNQNLVRRIFQDFEVTDQTIHKWLTECILHCGSSLAKEILGMLELSPVQPKYIYRLDVIYTAVKRGDAHLVQTLLENAKVRMGRLPAHYGATGFVAAIENGHSEMTPLFLSVGIKTYDVDTNHPRFRIWNSALPAALRQTTRKPIIPPEQLKLLIKACDEPIMGSPEHDPWRLSLFFACSSAIQHCPEYLSMLLAKGVDVNWTPPGEYTYATLLQQAMAWYNANELKNHPTSFELLLRYGADIHAPASCDRGATVLQYAAMRGNFEIVNKSLKAGANINESCGMYHGRTAIEGAAEHGRLNMVSNPSIDSQI